MLVYQKSIKRLIDFLLSLLFFLFLWPILLIISLLIKFSSPGPIIFKQKRTGKNGQPFIMYKFRSMVNDAEKLKEKYQKINEADGPVFKIDNDPRFTKIGKKLSHTGLDEFPQIFNILKGEMSLVGPRPLPINEEAKIKIKYQTQRRKAKPGLVSSWLIKGGHDLSFEQWMKLDLEDIEKSNLVYDLNIIIKSLILVLKLFFKRFFN